VNRPSPDWARRPTATERIACPAMAAGIPRVVWTLWLQGWEQAPPLVQACRKSWERRNPTWTVRALTRDTICDYLDVASTYPDVDMDAIPAAALSDMIRVALLAEHGGVWADSTAFCATPLDQWIDDCARTGFFAFARPGPDRMLSSWFLASEAHHPLMEEWCGRVSAYWRDRTAPDHYFWLHRLFADAYRTDPRFGEIWDATPKIRSDGPHYFVPYRSRLGGRLTQRARARLLSGADPMYKLSHRVQPAEADAPTAHEFFCQWADAPVGAPTLEHSDDQRLILAIDRAGEKVRWTCRHAVTGVRASLADRLRTAGVHRPATGTGLRDHVANLLRQRGE
jgi:hypothetical protein